MRALSCVGPFVVLVLGACASEPVALHEYLLEPPPLANSARDGEAVRLLPVTVAPYLDRDGIVLQLDGSEITVARQNRWAEPLDEAIGRYLQVAIANAAGRPVTVSPLVTGRDASEVRVRVHQFHGREDGQVRLVAEWSVAAPSGDRSLHNLDAGASQRGDGYAALVDAHAELLDRLATAIATSLDQG